MRIKRRQQYVIIYMSVQENSYKPHKVRRGMCMKLETKNVYLGLVLNYEPIKMCYRRTSLCSATLFVRQQRKGLARYENVFKSTSSKFLF